ncbi:MAG: RNA-binding protein [Methanothermococcus sp.]|uniref:ribosome assembly RNA-binding protein YhbY n=1 Tax=Methanothermococcus TaxID=155862 RepID=UPI00037BDC24|nr:MULTISPECIES: ribosome assembly RNA-binding protein YhbY [Methanothermococcus]MDK2790360.1 RNA-binding protein [Methanothermococcus sp.]MDK2988280.1 RNA-binding protein [Methanothermococcus sp.]
MSEITKDKRVTSKAKKILRAKSHDIGPVVWVGKEGVDKVIAEVKRQLKDKSLIKIKIRKSALESEDKKEIAEKIARETNSEIISLVGNVITLFRPKEGWKSYSTRKIKKNKYIQEFEMFRSNRNLRK